MKTPAPPDDLNVSDLVTVYAHRPQERCSMLGGVMTVQDTTGCGNVFRILAIELPYIAVFFINEGKTHRMVFDTRQTDLKKISPRYARALLGDDVARRVMGKGVK